MGFFFAVYTVVKLPDGYCMNGICILFQNSKSDSIEYYTLVFKIAFLITKRMIRDVII